MDFMVFPMYRHLFVFISKLLNYYYIDVISLLLHLFYILSASANECIQRNSLAAYSLACNNKISCNINPFKTSLASCGNQLATYFHLDYICKSN